MLETGCAEQCAHANGKQANMTDIEYKTEFSMWAISASPLQITTRIMNCTNATGVVTCKGWLSDLQKQIMLNTEVLAFNHDQGWGWSKVQNQTDPTLIGYVGYWDAMTAGIEDAEASTGARLFFGGTASGRASANKIDN
jgi:hypothetical protein